MPESEPVRVAAAGDVHCDESNRDAVARAFASLEGRADLVLLAGDLTTTGEPAQAAVLADACRDLGAPVIAVLGNHDWHVDRHEELVEVLRTGGIDVLDPGSTVVTVRGARVGVAGAKGFIGGFAGTSHLPDFGEPTLRRVYAECTAEIYGLDEGLRAISTCDLRIALLHYAPTIQTLEGEPGGIWAFLGTDRLAAPILEHEPHLALHGHAHAGAYEGRIGSVPVYNVSVPVIGRDFQVFELSPTRAATPIH
jgi:uncharacterized protein